MIKSVNRNMDFCFKDENLDFFAGRVVSWDGHCFLLKQKQVSSLVCIGNFNAVGVTILKVKHLGSQFVVYMSS